MISHPALNPVYDFVDSVESGDVESCDFVRMAVERFRRDMERQGTDDFPFEFQPERALAALTFFPLVLRHSIGKYAGLPFELEPWQAFGLANIFGWVRLSDQTRRFRSIYWSMGRKNGKTTFAAGIGLLLATIDYCPIANTIENVPEIILCATKREQVEKVMFAEMQRMRTQSASLEQRTQFVNRSINSLHNDGSIRCVGSDKPYSGLNPHAVIKDELHEFRETHRKFYDTMSTGGASRTQPLSLTFTTAGDDKSYIWLEEYRYAAGVISGQWNDESLFAISFELDEDDDPLDESLWIKANPNLGISVSVDYLRDQPKTTKIQINRFTRFHGNRLVSSTESAFSVPAWDQCDNELADMADADAIGIGCDLGGRDDFAAWASVSRYVDGMAERVDDEGNRSVVPIFRYEVRAYPYIAEDTERDLTIEPFAGWIHDGLIKVCKYPITEMKQDIIEFCDEYYVEQLAYDPAGGQQFAEEMEQEGIVPARMAQTYAMFNEPISEFSQAMQDGRLRHMSDPVLRWCLGNAVACRDRQDRFMLDKANSIDKIDPVVAVIMAYRIAMIADGQSTDDNLIVM